MKRKFSDGLFYDGPTGLRRFWGFCRTYWMPLSGLVATFIALGGLVLIELTTGIL